MAKQMSKNKLGRGMAALLGSSENEVFEEHAFGTDKVSENTLMMVPIENVIPNKDQPRKIFSEKEIEELSKSIVENGIIQPLTVSSEGNGKYQLIAGERRLRACKLARIEKVPVVLKKVTKKESLVLSIIENVQRENLNCVEEALAYFQLMNDFNLTQEEVAKKIGKERSTVANFLRILKLPREVIALLQKEDLNMGHAKVLASIKDEELAKKIANKVAHESLSVRELEKLIKQSQVPAASKKQTDINKLESIKDTLERKTGFHFALKQKKNGHGSITIKFSSESEFNDIFKFLTE